MTPIDPHAQAEVLAFLLSPAPYARAGGGAVSHVETHGAHVFLCGKVALKIKRAVRYSYMDLSTPELRHALLERELALNRITAPMIYRDVVPITRRADGGLALNGRGRPVEWVLRMHRFSSASEMTEVAASGRLTDAVATALGQVIGRFHAGCPRMPAPGDALIGEILDELALELRAFAAPLGAARVEDFLEGARQALARQAGTLRERSAQGHVRRVHGDLHLRNLVLLKGRPVLFDALEFDERLATCDVLYDLAFLLMDLCHRGFGHQANAVLNAWLLDASGEEEGGAEEGGAEDGGLAALPLFLSVRAAIRAMVLMQTDRASGNAAASTEEAQRYLREAIASLGVQRPTLTAIGGLSGTGKTVLARDLALRLAPCPGAIHLRTDTMRKQAAARASYALADRNAVYDRLIRRAGAILAAGHSVILDATFLDPHWRKAAQDLARRLDIPFHGLWLAAPEAVLIARVTGRRNDASDADAAVVRQQIAALASSGAPAGLAGRTAGQADGSGWVAIDAGGAAQATLARACTTLGLAAEEDSAPRAAGAGRKAP